MFRCQDVEDIGSLLPEVQEAVLDFARFGSMLTLEAFAPFKTGVNALENINSISEGSTICYILSWLTAYNKLCELLLPCNLRSSPR